MFASIIVPTYNRSDVIIRSLETWITQTASVSDFEVIIVDNNSEDLTPHLVKSFIANYPNFKYLKEVLPGSTNARHAGARVASAEILIFCDDDGLFNENFVNAILEAYKQNPDVIAVTGKIEIMWDRDPPLWIDPFLFMLGKLDYGDKIIYSTDLYLNGGVFSIYKNIFWKLGGFNPDLVRGHLIGDGDTGLVHKIHANNFIIGYTPYATMKHLQFVDRHGTIADIGRRFYNVGVGNSYGVFRANKFSFNLEITRYISFNLFFLLKKQIEYLLLKPGNMKIYFSLNERKGQLNFFMKFLNSDIRKEILHQGITNP